MSAFSDFVFCVCRENVGLVGLTRVGSRRVVQISAAFMLFFAIFGTVLLDALEFLNTQHTSF